MKSNGCETSRKVLLIGWDAADWKVINPLLDAGHMPNLERLVSGGVIGNLSTLYPILSPMLWTSIATGKRSFKHGINGFIEPDPHSGGIRPITVLSRKTKAVWNILNQVGKPCNVVGWWPSHPAEPLNGVMVSNHYQQAVADLNKPWPLAPRTVHPQRLLPHLAPLRIHPHELDGEHLQPFVPRAAEIDQQKDTRLSNIAKMIAECSSIHAAATGIMQLEPWDFMAVYYDAIDHFSHGFMKYHPPRLDWVSEEDFEMYKEVIHGAYRYHDMMLGVLMALAGPDTTIILMSDHGFHSDHLRPRILPNEPVGPAAEHRPLGIFVMRGPGIRRDERIYSATLLDIAPTILHLFGLPVGRDMDGRVLSAAWEQPTEVSYIESWDLVDGPSGQHPENLRIDAVDAGEAVKQLVALGYIEEPDEDKTVAATEAARELNYHLSQSYIDAQQHHSAAEILRQLWADWPEELRFGVTLLQCYIALERISQARQTADLIKSRKKELTASAIQELKRYKEEHGEIQFQDLKPKERSRVRRMKARSGMNVPALAYLEASVLQMERRYELALRYLTRAVKAEPARRGAVLIKRGDILLKLKRGEEAEKCFYAVLELDPVHPQAHLGLCRRLLQQRKYAQAADAARNSLGAQFHNPQGHYYHGVALRHCGEPELAIRALDTALRQNPNFPRAHSRLAMIYSREVNDPAKAEYHREAARNIRRLIHRIRRGLDTTGSPIPASRPESAQVEIADVSRPELADITSWIVVVSGLPRSGTSMMMQMLAAGGMPILSDQVRSADSSNPKGYFELESVKALQNDSSWVGDAQGHAVKVVSQLVPNLPGKYYYKIIMMDRDLDEVLQSQDTMLDALGRQRSKTSSESLRTIYQKQLNHARAVIAANPQAEMIAIRHRDVMEDPQSVAKRVADFLGPFELDAKAMIQVVDASLYRSKQAAAPHSKVK